MDQASKLRRAMGVVFSGGTLIGLFVGTALGVALVQWRFDEEISRYESVSGYAASCAIAHVIRNQIPDAKFIIRSSPTPGSE